MGQISQICQQIRIRKGSFFDLYDFLTLLLWGCESTGNEGIGKPGSCI